MSIITAARSAELVAERGRRAAFHVASDVADHDPRFFDVAADALAYSIEIGSTVTDVADGSIVEVGRFDGMILDAFRSVGITPNRVIAGTYSAWFGDEAVVVGEFLGRVEVGRIRRVEGALTPREIACATLTGAIVNSGTIAMMIDHLMTNDFDEVGA